MKFAVGVCVFSIFSATAVADFMDGKSLLMYCRGSNADAKGICMGYITGVADAISRNLCFPKEINTNLVVQIVIQHVERSPGAAQLSGESLVTNALKNAYPCKKR